MRRNEAIKMLSEFIGTVNGQVYVNATLAENDHIYRIASPLTEITEHEDIKFKSLLVYIKNRLRERDFQKFNMRGKVLIDNILIDLSDEAKDSTVRLPKNVVKDLKHMYHRVPIPQFPVNTRNFLKYYVDMTNHK